MKKRILYIVWIILIIIILILNVKLNFEKPILQYENSLDLNTQGIDPSNDDFFIDKGNKIGVVIVHGLAASPYQTKELANFLADRNITVYSIRVEGHGTNLSDFESKTWSDWYQGVKHKYNLVKSKTEKLYVLGISSGALLALKLAEQENVDGVVAIAAPLYLKDWKINLLPIISLYQRYHHFGVDKTQIGHVYENIPTETLSQFRNLVWATINGLQYITEPTMIIQSTKDQLVQLKSAEYAFNKINATKEKLLMTDVNHAVIRAYENEPASDHEERQKVFNEIYNFIIQ
jgi:carboxylesterase